MVLIVIYYYQSEKRYTMYQYIWHSKIAHESTKLVLRLVYRKHPYSLINPSTRGRVESNTSLLYAAKSQFPNHHLNIHRTP